MEALGDDDDEGEDYNSYDVTDDGGEDVGNSSSSEPEEDDELDELESEPGETDSSESGEDESDAESTGEDIDSEEENLKNIKFMLELGDFEDETPIVGYRSKAVYLNQDIMKENADRRVVIPLDVSSYGGISGTRNAENIVRWIVDSTLFEHIGFSLAKKSVDTATGTNGLVAAYQESISGIPIDEGTASCTVIAYRVWLTTREAVRVGLLTKFSQFPPFVAFLEGLTRKLCQDDYEVYTFKRRFAINPFGKTPSKCHTCIIVRHVVTKRVLMQFWFNPHQSYRNKLFPTLGLLIFAFLRLWFFPSIVNSSVRDTFLPLWNATPVKTSQIADKNRAFRATHYVNILQAEVAQHIREWSEEFSNLLIYLDLIVSSRSDLPF